MFSRGYCRNHWLRYFGKSIKRQSDKQKVKKDAKKALLKEDEKFYVNYWNNHLPHECFECGIFLGYSPYNWMFHHILPKNKYIKLRHNVDNIVYLCLQHHDNVERGTISNRMRELIELTKQKLLCK